MSTFASENQRMASKFARSSGRAGIVLLSAIAILGVSTVSGSLLCQWQQSGAVRESWVDPVAEQEAKVALKEAGFLVLTCPDSKHVYYVSSFGRKDIDDSTLERLAALRHVVTLDLSESNIDDEQLRFLSGLPKLVCLRLDGTRISHKGLACLADSLDLTMLYLDGTRVSDEGMGHIARMKDLQWLGVRDTLVTDEGLRRLRPNTPLKVVHGNRADPRVSVLRE
ncbi:MAG: hypothetical protein ACYSWU_20555 [Planctomycetota bacterium]|jgi:hypothetical protein